MEGDCMSDVMLELRRLLAAATETATGIPFADDNLWPTYIAFHQQLPALLDRLEAAERERDLAHNALMVSEQYRRKYAEGKYALYAMGGEVTKAAMKHLPCGGEGPLESYELKVEREHSPLLMEHNARLVEKLKSSKRLSAAETYEALAEEMYERGISHEDGGLYVEFMERAAKLREGE